MRIALALALVLSACGARAGEGVAWPEMAERENDGGESLAPRPGAAAMASAAADDDNDDDDIKVVSSGTSEAKPAAASEAKAATTGTAAAQPEETPITIEEIVIEIEE